jgi:glycerophosphoryl diester phosphodiesterase
MRPHTLLLGHRGVSGQRVIAENSFAAFDRALACGCDGFEFDLRLTACGRALVCHPPKVNGITVSRANRTQLLELPRLEDVFLRYGRTSFLNAELKVRGLESRVLAALRNRLPECGYVISSFIPDVLLEIKARRSGVPVGIICEKASQLVRWRRLPVEYVIAHKSLITRMLVERIHQANRKIIVWTVNQARAMQRFAAWGVDGIISDDVALLARTLNAAPRKGAGMRMVN